MPIVLGSGFKFESVGRRLSCVFYSIRQAKPTYISRLCKPTLFAPIKVKGGGVGAGEENLSYNTDTTVALLTKIM